MYRQLVLTAMAIETPGPTINSGYAHAPNDTAMLHVWYGKLLYIAYLKLFDQ